MYHYPTNKEEYWSIVEEHWVNLKDILEMFLPSEDVEKADQMRITKNRELAHLFNDAWFNAPDNRGIHSIPSWHVLCDLCSESYVLYDEGEEVE